MVELQVLGPIEAIGRGGALKIGGPKQRRLLAALTVNANTVVPNERLIDIVWSGEPPAGSHRGFKVNVARLRAALIDDGGNQPIVTHRAGYALEMDRRRLDATRFEELVDTARSEMDLGEAERAIALVDDALNLWRGPAYGEFADEEWAQASAVRLEGRRIAAHELRVEAQMAFGRHQELLPELDELINRFPYRDQFRGQRMLCLYRSGRHVDALREFQTYRQLLADEVGVDPGVELVELERRIVANDPDLLTAHPTTRRLRDYELGERIGADVHAVLYRATQVSIGRDVMIRVIRPELANQIEFIRRFEAELQLVAGLEHPHIVPLYDFWREPGGAYLVMRWLAGGSLEQRLRADGPLDLESVVRVADHIGGALAATHRAGIHHGDVSPVNVAFDDSGNAYLTGTGIAVRASGRSEGDAEDSTAADVLGLGSVLYAALTGSMPSRPSEDWSPDPVRPDIPAALDTAVRTACAGDASTRFADVADLVVAITSTSGRGLTNVDPVSARDEFLSNELERVNPYKGLRAFDEGDSADFFGRDELTRQLLADLRASDFVAVVGPSGSGKSSLVRAGVVPRLRDEGVFVATMIPGVRPFEELERALLRISPHSDATLLARLSNSPDGIDRAVRSVLPPEGRSLIVIDQFEELFTTTPPDRRDAFLDALAELVDAGTGRVRVVVTVRADFYDRPLSHPRLGSLMRKHTVAVTPLSTEELENAVTGPARRTGIEFDSALVADLVADAATNPGMLPLLQYALTELYANRKGRRIDVSEYQAMGGMSGTLAVRADALFDDLGETNAPAVRRLFTQLVTPGERTDDTRRRVLVSELAGVPEMVLDVYDRARLLTFDRDPVTREPTIEVAHEALIREWPRLRRWVDDDRENLRSLNHLATTAREWDDGGRDDDDLYRGARLATAVEIRESHFDSLGPLALEFLDASVGARDEAEAEERTRRERELQLERRSARRMRQIVAILTVATLLAGTLSWWALVQQGRAESQADVAATRELIGLSSASIGSDPELAVLLALEAARRAGASDPQLEGEVEAALSSSLGAWRATDSLAGAAVASSRDGEVLVTISKDGEVVAHDLTAVSGSGVTLGRAADPPSGFSPTSVRETREPDLVGSKGYDFPPPLAVSADGTTVMFVDQSGEPVVVDPGRPTERTSLSGLPGEVEYVELSPDGNQAVVGGVDEAAHQGTPNEVGGHFVSLWDLTTLEPIMTKNVVTADAEFSPDGSSIAVALPFIHGTEITFWDAASGERDASRDLCCHPGPDGVIRAAFSGDGSRLASIGLGEKRVRVWNLLAGGDPIEGPSGLDPSAIALNFDGTLLAQGDRDGSIHLFDLDTRGVILVMRGHRDEVVDLEFIDGGARLVSASSAGDTRVWDLDPDFAGTAAWVAHSNPLDVGHRVEFSPDSRTLLTTNGGGESRRWNSVTGDPVGPALTPSTGSTEVLGAAFSPDGTLIAVGGVGDNLRTFDATTGGLRQTYDKGFVYAHADVAFSPDGSKLATVPSGALSGRSAPRIFDVESGSVVRSLGRDRQIFETLVVWSPDGELIATGGPDTPVRIFDPSTSQWLETLDVHANDIAFSPDGSVLATAGEQLHVWDVSTWEQSEPFSGHDGSIRSIAFSPDGRELLGGGDDNQPRVWDVSTGAVLSTLPPHGTSVTGVAYSSDGTTLATIGRDGRVVMRPATLDALIALAESRVTRSLTEIECVRYLHTAACPEAG